MVYSAKSDDIGTIGQFTRLKYIYVTTNGSSTPANYQVKLTIVYEPEMKADFSDIRFNAIGHGYIDYWIESKTNSVTATVWVELPDAISDPGSNTICMYYGNDGLSDGGDGNNTFELFDNFSGSSVDLTKWDSHGTPVVSGGNLTLDADGDYLDSKTTYNRDVAMRFKANIASTTTGSPWIGFRGPDQATPVIEIISNIQTSGQIAGRTYVSSLVWTSDFHAINTEYIYDISWITNKEKFWVNDVLKGTITSQVPTSALPVEIKGYNGNTSIVDWILVRKYITNEPTPSYGTAQHQRRTPQFIN